MREAARVDLPEVVPLRGLGTGGGLCSGNEFIIIEMREEYTVKMRESSD